MIFKVKRGTHYRDGKCYKKGDVIDTPLDLVTMFGEARFERDFQAEGKADVVTTTKPRIPRIPDKDKNKGKDVDEKDQTDLGEDVTSEFSTAEQVEVKVYVKAKWYTIVDLDDGGILNEKKLRKKGVEPFLEQYLDADDDEEDADED